MDRVIVPPFDRCGVVISRGEFCEDIRPPSVVYVDHSPYWLTLNFGPGFRTRNYDFDTYIHIPIGSVSEVMQLGFALQAAVRSVNKDVTPEAISEVAIDHRLRQVRPHFARRKEVA